MSLLDFHACDSFRKLSTMGIKGTLAADIGQLSNLQSLYVESLSQLISTLISLSALAVCHGEPWLIVCMVCRDLSFNKDLGGVLTPTIGNLKQLTTL